MASSNAHDVIRRELAPGAGGIEARLEDRFGTTHFIVLAAIALAGCGAVLSTDVVMWFLVDGYDPVSQTISDLGAGPHAWLQDGGLVIFAVGVVALATAFILQRRATWRSVVARTALLLLAAAITVIALRNAYGNGVENEFELHREMVYALGVLVPAVLWFGPAAVASESRLSKFSKALAVVWVIAAPFFFMVPDTIKGLYERGLALIMLGSVAFAAIQLLQHSLTVREKARTGQSGPTNDLSS